MLLLNVICIYMSIYNLYIGQRLEGLLGVGALREFGT